MGGRKGRGGREKGEGKEWGREKKGNKEGVEEGIVYRHNLEKINHLRSPRK